MPSNFKIERDPSAILKFLDAIRSEADREREALGFLPAAAYREQILQRKLILLLATAPAGAEYAGHLLFGGSYPTARVQQTCVSPKYRGTRGASLLLRTLISQLEDQGYLSVSARIASELERANSFYERHGFVEVKRVQGGAARNRTLIIRARHLDVPSLFSNRPDDAVRPSIAIKAGTSLGPPTYAIDLNVFYDFVRVRVRSTEARTLVRAALSHDIRLVVTAEFTEELKRTSSDPSNDPVLTFAESLPTLRAPEKAVVERVATTMAAIIFDAKSRQGTLSANDKSDITHIALAAASSAAGYITSDEAILRAREEIFSRLGLDVIGLSEFASMLDQPPDIFPSVGRTTAGFAMTTCPFDSDISSFLVSNGMNGDRISPPQTMRGLPPRYTVAREGDAVLGVLSIDQSAQFDAPSRVGLCVNQDHPYSSTIIDSLLDEAFKLATPARPASLALSISSKHLLSYRVAMSRGFSDTDGRGVSLAKIVIGVPLVSKNWLETIRRVERVGDIRIQHQTPEFVDGSARIRLTKAAGLAAEIDAFTLETLLGPTLFALPGRIGTLVPIAKNFADLLIGGSPQLSFLADPEAAFLSRRTYFNSARTAKLMVKNSIVIFYESSRTGGRGAAIAAARICDGLVTQKTRIPEALQRGAVVRDTSSLSTNDEILATTFDNLVVFRRPVPRSYLQQLEGVAARNFQTATPIGSDALAAILEYGCLEQ